ncbi:MAG TPA: DUF4203 domain-containing protein [Thermomicrobiales bacterium]
MSGGDLLWGIVLVVAGVFVAVYGTMLFRFALAAMGFGLGFILAMQIFADQSEATRVLIAFIAGFIGAFALYALVAFSLWIAGAVLGVVIGVAVVGIIDIFGSRPDHWLSLVIAVVGGAAGAFFGRRLGENIFLLATSAAGAFMILSGTHVLFESRFQTDTTDATLNVAQRVSLFLFVVVFVISALSQMNERRLRRAVTGRVGL